MVYYESREQKLVNICFQIAMVAAEHMHGKSNPEIAEWVAEQLRECGFPTKPIGASWGVLMPRQEGDNEER